MSSHETGAQPVTSTLEADVFHLERAASMVQGLEESPAMAIGPDETLQLSRVDTANKVGAYVFRHRYTRLQDRQRADAYYALVDEEVAQPVERLRVLDDDLMHEVQWIESGEFTKIPDRRGALAKKTADGIGGEVRTADHEDIRQFMRLLNAAVSFQRQQRQAER